jgi:hypothetical protein
MVTSRCKLIHGSCQQHEEHPNTLLNEGLFVYMDNCLKKQILFFLYFNKL